MIPIHRISLPEGLQIALPSSLYKYAYRIKYNEPLKWGLFLESRNKKRRVKRLEAWTELSSRLRQMYNVPSDEKLWLHTRYHRHGAAFKVSYGKPTYAY